MDMITFCIFQKAVNSGSLAYR